MIHTSFQMTPCHVVTGVAEVVIFAGTHVALLLEPILTHERVDLQYWMRENGKIIENREMVPQKNI